MKVAELDMTDNSNQCRPLSHNASTLTKVLVLSTLTQLPEFHWLYPTFRMYMMYVPCTVPVLRLVKGRLRDY